MVVVCEVSEVVRQAGFTEDDHVIQAPPPNRADRPFDKCPNENRRVNSNSQIINQIGFCENHKRLRTRKPGTPGTTSTAGYRRAALLSMYNICA